MGRSRISRSLVWSGLVRPSLWSPPAFEPPAAPSSYIPLGTSVAGLAAPSAHLTSPGAALLSRQPSVGSSWVPRPPPLLWSSVSNRLFEMCEGKALFSMGTPSSLGKPFQMMSLSCFYELIYNVGNNKTLNGKVCPLLTATVNVRCVHQLLSDCLSAVCCSAGRVQSLLLKTRVCCCCCWK